jgi:hypothetical protein
LRRTARPAAGLLALLLTTLVACGRPREQEPVIERLRAVTADAAAAQAVAAMLSAYGGYDVWSSKSTAEYRYEFSLYGGESTPKQVTRQRHRLALRDGVQVTLEDLEAPAPRRVVVDGESLAVTIDGRPVEEPEQADFRRVYAHAVRWDFLTPWTLLEPGSRLTSRGVRTPAASGPVPPGECDVVRLRFETAGEGGGTDDWYDLYISRLSHLVEQIHSYRAAQDIYRLEVWGDHKDFGGIRVATRRTTYASDASGAAGRLEATAELSDVRFDASP